MEPSQVSEEIRRECKRLAASFGIDCWGMKKQEFEGDIVTFGGYTKTGVCIEWYFGDSGRPGGIETLWVAGDWALYWSGDDRGSWNYDERCWHPDIVARGLYCLGFDEAGLRAKVKYSLKDQEKSRLRHAMPCEFWPPKWLGGAAS